MHLVGFTIEIYYDARPYERQILKKEVLPFDNVARGKKLSCDRCLKLITEYTVTLEGKYWRCQFCGVCSE